MDAVSWGPMDGCRSPGFGCGGRWVDMVQSARILYKKGLNVLLLSVVCSMSCRASCHGFAVALLD